MVIYIEQPKYSSIEKYVDIIEKNLEIKVIKKNITKIFNMKDLLWSEIYNICSQHLLGSKVHTDCEIDTEKLTSFEKNFFGINSSINYDKIELDLAKNGICSNNIHKLTLISFSHDFGIGVPQNLKKAISGYKKSANMNCPLALIRLCQLYTFDVPGVMDSKEEQDVNLIKLSMVINKCLSWLIIGATNGNKYLQFILGDMYISGIGVEENHYLGIYWLEKAILQNYVPAISLLGHYSITNKITEVDHNTAIKLLKFALIFDDEMALHGLAYCFERGKSVDKDLNMGLFLYIMSARKRNTFAINALGYFFETGNIIDQNVEGAFALYRYAAYNGFSPAQCNLGYLYQKGIGTKVDYKKSAKWFGIAANHGLSRAEHNLSQCYIKGLGVKHNEYMFLKYILKSVSKNNVYAIHSLGIYFLSKDRGNNSDDQNYKKSNMLFEIGAHNNFTSSLTSLGIAYRYGRGVPVDLAKSFYYMLKSANSGDKYAQQIVGIYFENGIGVEINMKKAIEYYQKSADQQYPPAMYALGEYYLSLFNDEYSRFLAFKMLSKSQKLGYKRSLERLGDYYSLLGDHVKAFNMYQSAAKEGVITANFYVGMCYYSSIGVKHDMDSALRYFYTGAVLGDKNCVEKIKMVLGKNQPTQKDSLAQCA